MQRKVDLQLICDFLLFQEKTGGQDSCKERFIRFQNYHQQKLDFPFGKIIVSVIH